MNKLLYSDLTYKIRGAIFCVWKELGPAFKEVVYHKALKEEFRNRKIPFEDEKIIEIIYNGKKIGAYRPDFIMDKKIVVELKAIPAITPREEKQIWYYLKGTNHRLALLVNFGGEKLEIRRWIYDKNREKKFPRPSA